MKPATKIDPVLAEHVRFSHGPEIAALRHRLGMSQTEFWARVGVTQSGGSRMETGGRSKSHSAPLPASLQMLLTIAYGTEAQALQMVATLRMWRPGGS